MPTPGAMSTGSEGLGSIQCVKKCTGWNDINEWISTIPLPEVSIAEDGEIDERKWAFRGVKSHCSSLEPSIEREARSKSLQWAALETLVISEFKARANSHLLKSSLPRDELTWLADMQHYGVPTRLLDFTYSPYVALYFAIRQPAERKAHAVKLYAVNTTALNLRFSQVASQAVRKAGGRRPPVASLNPDDFSTDKDMITAETEGLRGLIEVSLVAKGKQRSELNRQGCVSAAVPPSFNPRLTSQQGLFLLNCAEQLTFQDSLTEMMGNRTDWLRSAVIPVAQAPEIEQNLFRMNIHEQSLFPDIEGLSGLIRQKIRLQWR